MVNDKKRWRRSSRIFLTGFGFAILVSYLFIQSTYEEKEDAGYQKVFQENYHVYALNIPDQIDFCDEEVPLQMIDVREKLDRELLVNTYWQSNMLLFLKRSHRWFPVIEPILEENGVPDDFKYLALIESGRTPIVSPAGATGFWQIMKATGKEKGLRINKEVDERYHVEKSTRFACEYLKEAKEKFGSWTLAAASYNMGMNGMRKQLDRQKVNNYYDLLLNAETSRYLFRILAVKHIVTHAPQYGFTFRSKHLYPTIETEEVLLDSSVTDFADYAFQHQINYKVLKYFNPWLRQSYLHNTQKDTFWVKIPTEKYRRQIMLDLQLPETEEDTVTAE